MKPLNLVDLGAVSGGDTTSDLGRSLIPPGVPAPMPPPPTPVLPFNLSLASTSLV
jgi:hypothetical protein